jgi:stathmin
LCEHARHAVFCFIFFPSINTPQNSRPLEVKQSAVSTLEVRKTEVTAQLETKLTIAEQKREQEIQRKLETAKKHNEHLMEVKQTIESTEENRKTEKVTKIESKLTTAEQNREKEIQRKLEIIKKNEKRAEAVRQNKANLLAQGTPSSG